MKYVDLFHSYSNEEFVEMMTEAGFKPPYELSDCAEAGRFFYDRWLWDSGSAEDLKASEWFFELSWCFEGQIAEQKENYRKVEEFCARLREKFTKEKMERLCKSIFDSSESL